LCTYLLNVAKLFESFAILGGSIPRLARRLLALEPSLILREDSGRARTPRIVVDAPAAGGDEKAAGGHRLLICGSGRLCDGYGRAGVFQRREPAEAEGGHRHQKHNGHKPPFMDHIRPQSLDPVVDFGKILFPIHTSLPVGPKFTTGLIFRPISCIFLMFVYCILVFTYKLPATS